ncbi:uncharacterized protein Dana_GF25270 [Drosophila ananassae]|uniref:Uncharacterized protein n=1 Tax=Drosophila ananassae TaxID=7217 RepID=A0A0P9C2V6_DROAN|nr:uncharacterized protein Dana_GF25270 [Drosophila ananassae]
MKLTLASILVCIVLLGFANEASAAPNLISVLDPCAPPCGPGGKPCPGCGDKESVCKDLLRQIRELKDKIGKCVCG